ncbi:MAG TPA: MlaD family protein [Solirubrobacteraceae bacterium]|nr:MlaD family protein [Solirubrobacteraceae bacterium]
MKRTIAENAPHVLKIVGLAAIAIVVGIYILNEQRLRFPFFEDEPVRYEIAFSTAQAVTPGQGQTVQVAGVTIGRIGSVKLEDGRGIVTVEIEPEHADLVRTDTEALLRPRTGLKDMYIQLFRGDEENAPQAEPGYRIPVANTLTDVDLHEILAELDERTRDYLTLLVNGAGRGLKDRGSDVAEVFRRFEPTLRDLSRVNRAVARERVALRRLITSMAKLNTRLAQNPQALTQLVDTSAATFRAFAAEDDNLRATIDELAPTFEQARRTLNDLRPFARELRPATARLVPTMRALAEANREVREPAREMTPIIRRRIRPFVREARPVVQDLAPAAVSLSNLFPDLNADLGVLNRFFNMLAFNPGGREPASKEDREEGYLFWLAWVTHQTVNLINIDDANGPMRPVFLTGTCTTLQAFLEGEGINAALLEFGLNLTPAFATLCGDPDGPSVNLDELLQLLPPELIALLPEAPLKKIDADAGQKLDDALDDAIAQLSPLERKQLRATLRKAKG